MFTVQNFLIFLPILEFRSRLHFWKGKMTLLPPSLNETDKGAKAVKGLKTDQTQEKDTKKILNNTTNTNYKQQLYLSVRGLRKRQNRHNH